MYGKAFAPEYQGDLTTLSVNSSLTDVLAAGAARLRAAVQAGEQGEAARSGLAVAEAHRRLGQVGEADQAWKASYRTARDAGDVATMAWALWSGGTLARQRGALPLARRLLGLAAELGERGGDIVVRGYSLAGLAETGRIQGAYEAVGRLHEQLLAEARRRGEARHTVWALEGIAQMHRNSGAYDTAYELFEEAAGIASDADDRRGHAWALRGLADIVSVRDGDTALALALLSEAEESCRAMKLSGALAYNHKMRGNVFYRAGRYTEARDLYELALGEFRAMKEPRGEALSRLGLAKSLARLGRDRTETAAELADLAQVLERIGLRHAREMVARAEVELGVDSPGGGRPMTALETPVRRPVAPVALVAPVTLAAPVTSATLAAPATPSTPAGVATPATSATAGTLAALAPSATSAPSVAPAPSATPPITAGSATSATSAPSAAPATLAAPAPSSAPATSATSAAPATLAAPPTSTAPALLARCRTLVRPALAEAVGRLHPWLAEMAAYSFGWHEAGTDRATAGSTDPVAAGGTDRVAAGGTDRATAGGTDRATPAGTDPVAAGGRGRATAAGTDRATVGGRGRATRPGMEPGGGSGTASAGCCDAGSPTRSVGGPGGASASRSTGAPGGKGLRQALAVVGAEAVGGPARAGVPAAVAVELVHVFSLLHDDIMDGDETRRGRPTVWRAYGTGPAVLAGDALFALAVETLAAQPPPAGPAALRLLSGALGDLMRGQADDLLFAARPWSGPERVTPEAYRAMAEGKTGALLGCSAALGALLAGAPAATVSALDRAGRKLGVAFQVIDDVLGIWGDPSVTGKPVHADLREGKKTFPVLAALTTPAAPRLATLLAHGGDPAEAAALIEEAGGREAALTEANRLLTEAEQALTGASLTAGALHDLRSLVAFAVDRNV